MLDQGLAPEVGEREPGVRGAEVDGETRAGAKISLVEGGSPADKAGLKRDDVIIAIDGKTTSQGSALTGYVRQYSANDKVKLTVIRDSKKQDIDVTLADDAGLVLDETDRLYARWALPRR